MLTALVHVVLVLDAVECLEAGAPVESGAFDLPWQGEVCCDSSSGNVYVKEGANRSGLNLPRPPPCKFRGSSAESQLPMPPGGMCLDILCKMDENRANVTCDLKSSSQSSDRLRASPMGVSLLQLSQSNITGYPASEQQVACDAENSLMCSIYLNSTRTVGVRVTVHVSNFVAPPILLRIPPGPVKPSPPFNLSHIQTVKAELILSWKEPLDFNDHPLKYEVRYSSQNPPSDWQVVSALKKPNLSLDLKPLLKYTIQVRCTTQTQPLLWSDWSDPYYIYLYNVSYIPQEVVARPGENVTVHCVLNNHGANASMAVWSLNRRVPLDPSLYHPVNQRVSQITFAASKTGMYDRLSCTPEWNIPYSKINVEGGFINITCVTNGDIDTMICRWENEEWAILTLRSKIAEMSCDEMEERERGGEDVGEIGPECRPTKSKEKFCTFHPLKMSCYKLWLELPSQPRNISCKPVYVSPINHVKPNAPTDVAAVSWSSGTLRVTWNPPPLPVEGLQCQFRYHSLSVIEKWKFEKTVWVPRAEVEVPDMCQVYVVQVRCKHSSGVGYWSEWSDSVKSTTQNSRVPEHGPDFWRIRQDDPYRNQSNITLLFESFPANWNSYCVDGFIVQHRAGNGSVLRRHIDRVSSYSFEWNQELHVVTVEAYNSLGSSGNNVNMTLEKQPKCRCVRSFHVLVLNSTCVSLSWSLVHGSSAPLFMVVQWFPTKQQDSEGFHLDRKKWARLPYTDSPAHLRGDFFSSEEYVFHLYPVFADREGEAVFTLVKTGNPPAYMMLMFISLICIAVFVTLVLSQNQMKKIVWKDVPNPKKCSWAKGLDFKTMDRFEYRFRPRRGLQASPLPSENISKVIVVSKTPTMTFDRTKEVMSPDFAVVSTDSFLSCLDPVGEHLLEIETVVGGTISPNSLTTSTINKLQPVGALVEQSSGTTNSSAPTSVTYSKVLLADGHQGCLPLPFHYKEGSRCSSSDEGNFSANSSDTSESSGGSWDVDSCRGTESDHPRRSWSHNSVNGLSKASEQEEKVEVRQEKTLLYLEIGNPPEDEGSEAEEPHAELVESAHLSREDCSVELHPLLNPDESTDPNKLLQVSTCTFASLYMPQYRKHDLNPIPHI